LKPAQADRFLQLKIAMRQYGNPFHLNWEKTLESEWKVIVLILFFHFDGDI